MNCLLDVLAASGVPKAHTEHRWPVDVVTQVLRDHVGTTLPIRGGLTGHQAASMCRRIEAAQTGGWWYETVTHKSEAGKYTVFAAATRVRPRKLASLKRVRGEIPPISEDEMNFPGLPEVQDTRGRNYV